MSRQAATHDALRRSGVRPCGGIGPSPAPSELPRQKYGQCGTTTSPPQRLPMTFSVPRCFCVRPSWTPPGRQRHLHRVGPSSATSSAGLRREHQQTVPLALPVQRRRRVHACFCRRDVHQEARRRPGAAGALLQRRGAACDSQCAVPCQAGGARHALTRPQAAAATRSPAELSEALRTAATKNDVAAAKAALEAGADKESKDSVRLAPPARAPNITSRAWPPHHHQSSLKPAVAYAAEAGSVDVLKLLIDAKAPFDENDFVRPSRVSRCPVRVR